MFWNFIKKRIVIAFFCFLCYNYTGIYSIMLICVNYWCNQFWGQPK